MAKNRTGPDFQALVLSCACDMRTQRRLTGEFFLPLTLNMIVTSITQGLKNGFKCKETANKCVTLCFIYYAQIYYVYRILICSLDGSRVGTVKGSLALPPKHLLKRLERRRRKQLAHLWTPTGRRREGRSERRRTPLTFIRVSSLFIMSYRSNHHAFSP
jgi:hypothetical protein